MSFRKYINVFLCLSASLVLIIFAVLYRNRSLDILSDREGQKILRFGIYKERNDSIASKAFATLNSDRLVFEYELSSHFSEPFAGVYLYDSTKSNSTFDLSGYDQLAIKLTATHGKRIPVSLAAVVDSSLHPTVKRPVSYTFVLDHAGRDTTYYIALSDFKVPSWWLREHHITSRQLGKNDFSKVRSIIIGSCQALPPNVRDVVQVNQLKFQTDNKTLIVSSMMALLVFGIAGFYYNGKKTRRVGSVEIDYKPLKIDKGKNKDFNRVIDYLADKYPDPDLGLQQIQTALGLSGKTISKLIKDQYGLSFNDYLNQLRITEVKRLLKETSLPVSEIAYNVGYNNISHFNRVFKNMTGQSPKQFREETPAG